MRNFSSSMTAYDLQCVWTDVQKNNQRLQSECFCFWRIMFLSIWSPPLRWYLSLTSLHLSFHLLLFLVSQDPQSLLRARKLQLKLSQSGTQLRLSGDLRGVEGTRLVVKKTKMQKIHKLFMHNQHAQPVVYHHAESKVEHQMQKILPWTSDWIPVVHLKWRDYSPEWNETLLRVLHIKRLLLKWWQKQHDALLSPRLQIVMSQENNSW